MYPKVFSDFAAAQETYGPVSALPTPTYFYGMKPEDEVFVDIEKGKTLVIRCLAVGDTDEKGMVTVFFELNGQPRRVKVPDRAHGASNGKARPKAEAGNDAHLGAPMPGVVSGVSISAGQSVKAGDVLLSIEAMKMETALHAERDGVVAEVLVKAATRSTPRISCGVRLTRQHGIADNQVLTCQARSGIEPAGKPAAACPSCGR